MFNEMSIRSGVNINIALCSDRHALGVDATWISSFDWFSPKTAAPGMPFMRGRQPQCRGL